MDTMQMEFADWSGLGTGKLDEMYKIELVRVARKRVGPGGRVQVITFAGDPVLDLLPGSEREKGIKGV